ncbi:hypothetical protein MPTK1_7g04190 [Marchantia polymorpha subsp. ruderalis]|uniref:Uncharacterized protein n=2 Tax=Marchantia polymorpha TaxID=3197 RepID=A0AAF6BW03_MARPO|nr:hypothetical protein MARPO_0062s0107 [Marchantia polymorpha]BBN16187.1 hypothetical protein Mp_7g04190 [Marchantia polymorpha subsp. ruderalis]|eukprot:PTQ36696.1 hypothetical protein MARPO_0062s0107 [Marchantia polymorpha]
MGSLDCLGALAPQFLGLQADGAVKEAVGCGKGGDTMMKQQQQRPADSEWHSISLDEASRPEVEYCFKLVERKDGSETRPLFGSSEVSQQTRKLELSLCGLSRDGKGDEAKSMGSYPDGLKKDRSYITMEALDSSNGVKEVRVSFHGLEDSRKGATDTGFNPAGYDDDGCLSLVSQFRALFSPPKLSCGGLLSGDGKHSLFDGLGSLLHSFKTSDLDDSSNTDVAGMLQPEHTTTKTSSTTMAASPCKESFPKRGALFEARDPQSRSDALPLAHYRPEGPAWCSSRCDGGEQKRDGASIAPKGNNPNSSSPVNMNCKKPPKPPKPPRHPGRATSLDSATIAAHRAAAARRKMLKQAAAKRKARVAAPASSGTPFIALALTLGFGILMVFQGLFVQSSATYGDSDKAFVDVPSDQFGHFSAEADNSYGYPYQIDAGEQGANEVADPGKAEMLISNAFFKSMQEIQSSSSGRGSLPSSDRAAGDVVDTSRRASG